MQPIRERAKLAFERTRADHLKHPRSLDERERVQENDVSFLRHETTDDEETRDVMERTRRTRKDIGEINAVLNHANFFRWYLFARNQLIANNR